MPPNLDLERRCIVQGMPEEEGFELEFETKNFSPKDNIGCSTFTEDFTCDCGGSKIILDSTILDIAGVALWVVVQTQKYPQSTLSLSWFSSQIIYQTK